MGARAAGGAGCSGRILAGLTLRRGRDLGQVARRERALAHLVAALRALGEFKIVGDEDEAERFRVLQPFEQVDDVGLGVFVEVARGFVGEQQRRRIDERTGDRDPALLAAGHAAGIGVGAVRETDTRDEIVRARVRLLGLHGAAEQGRNGDVVDRGQVRQQARELEDEADVARAEGRALAFRQRPHVGAVEQ
jgi:hypothetical protein